MSDASGARPAEWDAIHQLLESGAYEQAADMLQHVQSAAVTAGALQDTAAIAAVREICLICLQCQAEVEWHRQAGQATERREQQLRSQAQIMLDWVRRQVSSELGEIPSPAKSTAASLATTESMAGETSKQTGLWRRIREFLLPSRRAPAGKAIPPVSPTRIEPLPPAVPPLAEPETAALPPPIAEQEQEVVALLPVPPAAPVTEAEAAVTPAFELEQAEAAGPPALTVYCLGPFLVYQDERPIEDWPSGKGQSIFKYLVTHRERPIAKEVLMDTFWPDATPEAARNNLNVAIHGLRRALRLERPDFSHVLFQNDAYLLNPELRLWVDVEEFVQHFRTGQRLEQAKDLERAVLEYHAADTLYRGEFLEEDRYEDWLLLQRQSLQDDYLNLLDRLTRLYFEQEEFDACILMCGKLLAIDSCREDAHRRLMRCYSHQGHYHLALRQYHLCVEALKRELDVEPDEATQTLYRQIRQQRSS